MTSPAADDESSGAGQTPWWLMTAAALAFLATGMYAWSLRTQLTAARVTAAQAANEAQAARVELAGARRESDRLGQTLAVLVAPDAVRVELAGQGAARAASGRACWSRSRGFVFNADRLPEPTAGRVYQLWVLAPKPVSAGVLTVSPDGSAMLTATLAAGTPPMTGVEVTSERGPAGSAAPTGAVLLSGHR